MSNFNGFTAQWWRSFREEWNALDTSRQSFGTIGVVRIVVSDYLSESARLEWNSEGALISVSQISEENDMCPTFIAPRNTWAEFVSGRASAARLVMRGNIRFVGSKLFLLAHGPKFDMLSVVGRKLMPDAERV